jgi:hypothetical protein
MVNSLSDFEHDVACIGKCTDYKNIDIIYHYTKCSFFENAPAHILANWYQPWHEYVRKVSSRFEYYLQIFAAEFVLILKMVVLDTELNSASNGDVFKGGHRAKRGAFARNTGFWRKYISLIFIPRLVPTLKVVLLNAELMLLTFFTLTIHNPILILKWRIFSFTLVIL